MPPIPPIRVALDRVPLALIVDRDADTRRMYAHYLREQGGCSVDEVEDGREALAMAISRRPDVIVTETRLPGLSGFDLCALLRGDIATSAIRIVVVTGDAFDADLRRARRAGADVVLTKPCLPDTLLDEIVRLLASTANAADGASAVTATVTRPDNGSSASQPGRVTLSRSHARHRTSEPPIEPPALICPSCDLPLRYLRSHIGGVSARYAEQWDYYECTAGCGTFQYRSRTKKLRRV